MSLRGLTIVVSIGATHWFVLESMWSKAKLRAGYRVYGAPRGLRALYFLAVPLFVYGAAVNYRDNPGERWVSGILLLFAFLCIYFFPATILLSREKLVSVRWLGARRTEMTWTDVNCVYTDPVQNSVIVQDKIQNRIVHTILNVDRDGFLEQIRGLSSDLLSRITLQL
jgi:hypothetical protein